jgi:hypothetical protein
MMAFALSMVTARGLHRYRAALARAAGRQRAEHAVRRLNAQLEHRRNAPPSSGCESQLAGEIIERRKAQLRRCASMAQLARPVDWNPPRSVALKDVDGRRRWSTAGSGASGCRRGSSSDAPTHLFVNSLASCWARATTECCAPQPINVFEQGSWW